MEHDGSLPYSQEPVTGTYPEPDAFQSTPSHPISLRYILILPYNLWIDHLGGLFLFPSIFMTKIPSFPCMLHVPPISCSLIYHPNKIWCSVQVMTFLITLTNKTDF